MAEIYWIQRLDAINTVAWVIFLIALLAMIAASIGTFVERDFKDTLTSSEVSYKVCVRTVKIATWVLGISLLIGVFVPTERQLYAIYGIGGTIDYVKSNDTAKQLPDKVVKALDAWVDNQINDNEKEN